MDIMTINRKPLQNKMSDIRVYLIVNLDIHDPEKYRVYEKEFFPLLKKHNGDFITYDDSPLVLEGPEPSVKGRVILFSFPSEEDADNWWNDPDYQALSENRRAGTTTLLQRVKGMPPRK